MINAPDSLPDDIDALRALLLAERARHAGELAAERNASKDEITRLTAIIKELQRHRFGRRSERLDPNQLLLSFEDVEQALAAATAAAEKDGRPRSKSTPMRRRNINRGALPAHLPREEVLLDVEDKTCACCGGLKHRIGEDVSERLDVIPVQLKVIVTRRPKYACQACNGQVSQAPAPERLIASGIPTEALVAHVLVAKYADHLPLYRQAQIFARQGITLDRSTLADWVGRAAYELRAVHARLLEHLKQSTKLFADSAQDEEVRKHVDHVVRPELTTDSDGQAFAGELIDDVEHAISFSIVGAIFDEVVGPDMVGALRPQPDA